MPSKVEVVQGDCLEVLRGLPANSLDALVTDPPAGIAFMGKEWDEDKGGRTNWIWWLGLVMREVLRVLKPGAHGFVWALPRTSHWTAMALEDAGFEIRDRVVHVFGSGFPKSLDVSKGLDRDAGARRAVIGTKRGTHAVNASGLGGTAVGIKQMQVDVPVTVPTTPSAKEWSGYGTALKPAMEDWWLVRKPLEGTVVENVKKWGTGAINIDGARVGDAGGTAGVDYEKSGLFGMGGKATITSIDAGRWPANFVLSHAAKCKKVGTKRTSRGVGRNVEGTRVAPFDGGMKRQRVVDTLAQEVVEYACAEGCPVLELDRQSGMRTSGARAFGVRKGMGFRGANGDGGPSIDSSAGGASRFFHGFDADPDVAKYDPFFYTPKSARSEREMNLGALERTVVGSLQGGGVDANDPVSKRFTKIAANVHPTVKPIALMRHLVRLITPPKGRVLDCFGGSGSTGVACLHEAVDALLIERDTKFVEIIRGRCGLIG